MAADANHNTTKIHLYSSHVANFKEQYFLIIKQEGSFLEFIYKDLACIIYLCDLCLLKNFLNHSEF